MRKIMLDINHLKMMMRSWSKELRKEERLKVRMIK